MEFFTVLKYFLSFRIFEQVVLVLETRFCPEFTVLNIYFSSFRILNNLRLPRKTGSALEFLTVLNYFLSFRFMRNLSLPWNQSFPWIFQAGGRPLPPPAASYATAKTYAQYFTLGYKHRTSRMLSNLYWISHFRDVPGIPFWAFKTEIPNSQFDLQLGNLEVIPLLSRISNGPSSGMFSWKSKFFFYNSLLPSDWLDSTEDSLLIKDTKNVSSGFWVLVTYFDWSKC